VPADYRVRLATLADADVLVRHRIGMFTDMGVALDVDELDRAFRAWLGDVMPRGMYRAWLVDAPDGAAVGGGGITIMVDLHPIAVASQAQVYPAWQRYFENAFLDMTVPAWRATFRDDRSEFSMAFSVCR
jgi:hypothetical protein